MIYDKKFDFNFFKLELFYGNSITLIYLFIFIIKNFLKNLPKRYLSIFCFKIVLIIKSLIIYYLKNWFI